MNAKLLAVGNGEFSASGELSGGFWEGGVGNQHHLLQLPIPNLISWSINKNALSITAELWTLKISISIFIKKKCLPSMFWGQSDSYDICSSMVLI